MRTMTDELLDADESTWRANVTLAMRALTDRVAQLEREQRHSNESFAHGLEGE